MLPAEDAFANEVQTKLEIYLQYGYTLLKSGISILTERVPQREITEEDKLSYRIGCGLNAKACKLYRSILHLAEIGAGHDIEILARSMFETSLATIFVVQSNLKLNIRGVREGELTSDFRAKLYLAFPAVKKYNQLLESLRKPQFAIMIDSVNIDRVRDESEAANAVIGPDWSKRIKKHYSGCGSVEELAKQIGEDFADWYHIVYRDQSNKSHANDGYHHVHVDDDSLEHSCRPIWHTTVDSVRVTLEKSYVFFLRGLTELNNRFKFSKNVLDDIDTEAELDVFRNMLEGLQKMKL
jgi:hypothetical protein